MPRFDNENELLEKLRDDSKNQKILSEFVNGKLEKTCYEIVNGMVILTPYYGLYFALLVSNLLIFRPSVANDEKLLFLINFDVKINDDNYYSPKAMVFDKTDVKGDDIFATKPVIMFEILTHKNKHLLNAKFEHYQKIDTLQEYVLVDLNNPQILVYRKDNHWQKELLSFDDKLYLKSVDYTVKVADIYENIEF